MNLTQRFPLALLPALLCGVPKYLLAASAPQAAPASAPKAANRALVQAAYARLPLLFEKNLGQFSPEVRFLSRGAGYNLALKSDEAVLELQAPQVAIGPPQLPGVLKMKLVGANAQPRVSALQPQPTKINYLIGRDRTKWRTDVATSGQVLEAGVYPGIDLKYYGNQRQLEYDFIVAPHADPSKIRMRFGGARTMRLNARGELVLGVGSEKVVQHAPRVYQQASGKRVPVAGHYVIGAGQEVGFEVGSYDHSQPLVIDPVLSYSTYLSSDKGAFSPVSGIAVDSVGNAYVTGEIQANASTLGGSAGLLRIGNPSTYTTMGYVAKLNPNGSALLYVTVFSGSSQTESTAIAVDNAGNAYVTGETYDTDFPTRGAFQPALATNGNDRSSGQGDEDVFLVKLNAAGSDLLYSTYFGGGINTAKSDFSSTGRGKGTEGAKAIAVDDAGRAYITGGTSSVDLPVRNAAQSTLSGSDPDRDGKEYGFGVSDAFVAAFDTTATGDASLLYSTHLGNTPFQSGYVTTTGLGIALAGAHTVVVTGYNQAPMPSFPTRNALQSVSVSSVDARGSRNDAFVTEIDISRAGLDSLVFSTYLGGSSLSFGTGVAVDSTGSIYVTGTTTSSTMAGKTAVLLGPGGANNVFVAKLSPAGDALIYLTSFGGSGPNSARGIGVDSAGNAYISGYTSPQGANSDFPLRDPLPKAPGGLYGDAFVVKLNTIGSAFQYSTLLGGSSRDSDHSGAGPAIAVNSAGDAYLGGNTNSTDFPLKNPLQSTGPASPSDTAGFVVKLSEDRLVVNSTGDRPNASVGSSCDTGQTTPDGSTECTLRAALEEANAKSGIPSPQDPETIRFSLPGASSPTIRLSKPLPTITRPLVIDGTTQPGSKMVEVSGDGAGSGAVGLSISAGDSVVRGLVINGFAGDGVRLSDKGNNTIEGCFLGTDISGTSARGNGGSGIHVLNSPDNLIGGVKEEQANVLSGNVFGVFIEGIPSRSNRVQGCFIGTDKNGTSAIGNTGAGVYIKGAPDNLIGGADSQVPGTRNIISGNSALGKQGAQLTAARGVATQGETALNNKIQGNFIGTDKSGSRALGNYFGVDLGANNTGPSVALDTLVGGPSATPGVAPGNLISGNSSIGLLLNLTKGNTVQGNLIGTNASGTAAIGNGKPFTSTTIVTATTPYNGSGICLSNSFSNTIGGSTAGARNVVSGNVSGILLNGLDSAENVVAGNFIGTDLSGSRAVGNRDGVVMTVGARYNLIGGTEVGAGNVLSGNTLAGVRIDADTNDLRHNRYDSARSTTRNRIQGNFISTDKSGNRALGNVLGVEVGLVRENTIGGTESGAGNVISGNRSAGVALLRATGEVTVQGNRIGVGANGNAALPNLYGVFVFQSDYNRIGGETAGAGNVISGNTIAGLVIAERLPGALPAGIVPLDNYGSYVGHNVVQGNLIGTNASGSASVGNGRGAAPGRGAGILLGVGANGALIGGTSPAQGNVLSGNTGSGVAVVGISQSDPAEQINVVGNLIGVAKDAKSALPNTMSGVRLTLASRNAIGQLAPGSGNTIAFNGLDGVTVVSGRGNTILSNSIYSNRKLGINLVGGVENAFGVTFNHSGSASGPNDLQNFPEITDIQQVGGLGIVSATLQSKPNTHYVIQFFSNPGRTPSGYGQGQKYLGTTEVTTNSKGLALITGREPLLGVGQTLSMTATNAQAGTSEFSALPFAISGQITHFVPDPNNPGRLVKQGIAGVGVGRIKRSGPSLQIAAVAITNAQGFYSFKFTPPSIYAILPVKEGPDFHFVFDPFTRIVILPVPSGKSGAPDATSIDFTTYTISGLAKDAAGRALAGVTVTLSGAKKRTLVTNSQGRYLFDGLGRGSYTVSADSGFSPPQKLSLPRPGTIPSAIVNFVRAAPSSPSTFWDGATEGTTVRLALGTR